MPGSVFVSAVGAVDWSALRSTYESGEVVRDIVLRLGSLDQAEVEWAWEQISETVLQHQGTVYPATAAAAPFLCQLVLDAATPWRAALTAKLAFLSVGHDEPFAPAGTARAVRNAIRSSTGQLFGLWGTADEGLDMALVAVSVAFPEHAAVVTPDIRDWFGRSEPPFRTALGLALAVHGLTGDAVGQILAEEVDRDARTAAYIRRRRTPGGPWLSKLDQGPSVYSPVLGAIQLAARLRAGEDAECDAFSGVFSLLLNLMDYGRNLGQPSVAASGASGRLGAPIRSTRGRARIYAPVG
jgi:hypothetical protein